MGCVIKAGKLYPVMAAGKCSLAHHPLNKQAWLFNVHTFYIHEFMYTV